MHGNTAIRSERRALLEEGLALGGAALLAIAVRLRPLRNPDVLWQVRTGERILSEGHRLTSDAFSFTFRGAPLLDHEPAFEVVVAWLHRWGGLGIVWWVNLAVVVIAVVASVHTARSLVPSAPARVAAAALVVATIDQRFELRAEGVSFAAIAIAHALRRGAELGRGASTEPDGRLDLAKWARWISPVLVASAAAPFHALALLVSLVPLAYAAESSLEWIRTRDGAHLRSIVGELAVSAACVISAEVTSPGIVRKAAAISRAHTFGAHIVEHYSTAHFIAATGDFLPIAAVAAGVLATVGLVVLARRDRTRGRRVRRVLGADVFLVAGLSLPSALAIRLVSVSALAAMPWTLAGLAVLVDSALSRVSRGKSLLAAAVGAVAVVGGALVATRDLGSTPVTDFAWWTQPVAAVARLRDMRPNAQLFNPFNFGAYLIYAGWPPRGVAIDSRAATLYSDAFARRYYDSLGNPAHFEEWAREAPFDTVLLHRGHRGSRPLREYLETSPSWRVIYRDSMAVVFVSSPRTGHSPTIVPR